MINVVNWKFLLIDGSRVELVSGVFKESDLLIFKALVLLNILKAI